MSDAVVRDDGRLQLRLGLLLSRKFLDPDGREAGRVEEVRTHRAGSECLVDAYLIGSIGLIDRLGARLIVRRLLRFFGMKGEHHSAIIPWDAVDWSDPERPRLRRPHATFRTTGDEEQDSSSGSGVGGGGASSGGPERTRREQQQGPKERQQK